MLTIAAAAMILAAGALVVIPRAVGSARTDMVQHEFIVQCLPMRVAQDIAQTLLVSPGNEVQVSRGSRVLRVRATTTQMQTLQSMFASTATGQPSCDNTPAGR